MILYTLDYGMKTSFRYLDILKYLDTGHCDKISYKELLREKKESIVDQSIMRANTVLVPFILQYM